MASFREAQAQAYSHGTDSYHEFRASLRKYTRIAVVVVALLSIAIKGILSYPAWNEEREMREHAAATAAVQHAETVRLAILERQGSREQPFVLSSTGELVVTLNDSNDVRVVVLDDSKAGVTPNWRVTDPDHVVLVRVFDLNARKWSKSFEFTSATSDGFIYEHMDIWFKLIEFKAPALDSNETVKIVVTGAPYGTP